MVSEGGSRSEWSYEANWATKAESCWKEDEGACWPYELISGPSWRKSGERVYQVPAAGFFQFMLGGNLQIMNHRHIKHLTSRHDLHSLITTPMPPKSRPKKTTPGRARKRRVEPESEDEGHSASSVEDDALALDSDNLDDDAVEGAKRGEKVGAKRSYGASRQKLSKRARRAEGEGELELKEGQEIVGRIVRAPETGQGESRADQGRADPNIFPQFLLDRFLRTRSTFWNSSNDRNTTIGNGSFPFISATTRPLTSTFRFKLNGTRASLLPVAPAPDGSRQNPCSGKRRKSGRRS